MTEFQLGLLLIGALLVAAVIVYNKIQERTVQRRAERAFGSQHDDVLLDERTQRREPTLEPAVRKSDRDLGSASEALPDRRLDYLITLRCGQAVPAAVFLEGWAPLEQRFGRRVMAACAEDGTGWKRVAQGDRAAYATYLAALQLVSRVGVVSEAELIEFRSEVETMAAKLGATTAAPEMKQAMEAAREMDQFCADTDIQIVFHLIAPAGGVFPLSQVQAAASSAGMAPGPDGRHALRDVDGRVLYSLAMQGDAAEAIRGLTIALDVPRIAEVGRTYESMVRCARQLAVTLGGSLVDDNGNGLDERALAAIGAELDTVRRSLEAHGVAPGGPLALRLFA
jgi:ZipA, C-terminal FtsZ-binding domain